MKNILLIFFASLMPIAWAADDVKITVSPSIGSSLRSSLMEGVVKKRVYREHALHFAVLLVFDGLLDGFNRAVDSKSKQDLINAEAVIFAFYASTHKIITNEIERMKLMCPNDMDYEKLKKNPTI